MRQYLEVLWSAQRSLLCSSSDLLVSYSTDIMQNRGHEQALYYLDLSTYAQCIHWNLTSMTAQRDVSTQPLTPGLSESVMA
jgi:hypothetical protein